MPLPERSLAGILCWLGAIGLTEWCEHDHGRHHQARLWTTSKHAGASGPRHDVSMSIRGGGTAAGACAARSQRARPKEDRGGGSRSPHSPDCLLCITRRHSLRPIEDPQCADGNEGANIGGLNASCTLDNRHESEAVAREFRLGQVAFFLGSFRRSRLIGWPTQFPTWQHVPGRFDALEHEWKDGESWRPAADPLTPFT